MIKDVQARQLEILLALDKARDSIMEGDDPLLMFEKIMAILRDYFKVDGCVLLITTDETEAHDIVINEGMSRALAHQLGRQVMTYSQPTTFSDGTWAHGLGLRIWMEERQEVLGGLFLGRREKAFDKDDVALLILAESQIDSAVMQARTLWHLAERNRELEAIYRIDRLRDDGLEEEALFAQFAGIMLDYLKADFCLILMRDSYDDEQHVRSLVNKCGLGSQAIEQIRREVSAIEDIQLLSAVEGRPDLQFLGASLVVAGLRVGAVVVGRGRAYGISEHRLMHAMVSQMDSAIAKHRVTQQLAQRTRELEAIYRIDTIRDQESDFDLMIQRVLGELCDAVHCETGYIMLYNTEEEAQLELRATTRDGILNHGTYTQLIEAISRKALQAEKVVIHNDENAALHSLIAAPLILNERVIGVFGAINSHRARGFSEDDNRMLSAITSQVDTAIFERLERRRMRRVLSRSVDPKVLEALLKRADDSLLMGERVELSVLFGDLRGSTEWAERTEADELVRMLNTFLGLMTEVIFKYGGTLDKFVGDEVIALFGAPVPMADHAQQAARCALEMQEVHHKLQHELASQGYELPPMGVGINSGEAIAGEFGPPIRTDFTAMGRVMNLGARLCGVAEGGQCIVSESTYRLIHHHCEVEELAPIQPKGFRDVVEIYALKRVD